MRWILNGRNRGAVPEVPRVGVGWMSTLRAAREADNEWRGTGGARGLHQRLELDCNVDEGVDDSTGAVGDRQFDLERPVRGVHMRDVRKAPAGPSVPELPMVGVWRCTAVLCGREVDRLFQERGVGTRREPGDGEWHVRGD